MNYLNICFIFLVGIHLSSAYFSFTGRCINFAVKKDFDAKKFSGIWYEIKRLPNVLETDMKCAKIEYNYIDKKRLNLTTTGLRNFLNEEATIEADLRLAKIYEPNKFNIQYSLNIFDLLTVQTDGKYEIWETDYEDYAIAYSCLPYNVFFVNFKIESVWILSRKTQLSNVTLSKVEKTLESKGLNTTQLEMVDHDC